MPHLPTPPGIPGISSLFAFRPETAPPLLALAEQVLRGPSPLTPTERELIATFVSSENACRFCTRSHRATTERLGAEPAAVSAVLERGPAAAETPRMRALLALAAAVRGPVAPLPDELVSAARAAGATDVEIHDAVLVAAAFSMWRAPAMRALSARRSPSARSRAQRHVESLATPAPDDPEMYATHG